MNGYDPAYGRFSRASTAAVGLERVRTGGANRVWRLAQWSGLLATVLLLAGLWSRPDLTLRILWYVVVPILPAAFLLHPGLWRNVCPLATLSLLPGRRTLGWKLNALQGERALLIGMVLLALLVPARRFALNANGPLLAVVIASVGVIAFITGFLFDRKAGFCSGICPVLPVERLYGQRPLLAVPNVRCESCSLCTQRGCLDLAPGKSIPQMLAGSRRTAAWLLRPYGIFAAAFPGFVLAYFLTRDGPLTQAGSVYLRMGAGVIVSYVMVAGLVLLSGISSKRMLPAIGAVSLLAYYWYAADGIGKAWALDYPVVLAMRVLAILLILFWLLRISVSRSRLAR